MASKQDRERRDDFQGAGKRAEEHGSGRSFNVKVPEGFRMFQPEAGWMYLDIIAYRAGAGNPHCDKGKLYYERTYWSHRGLPGGGRESYICLSETKKEPCPICEYRAKLARNPDVDDEIVKGMAPKERQLFWVINTRDRKAGGAFNRPMLWDMSYYLFGQLLDEQVKAAKEDDSEENAVEIRKWDRFAHPTKGSTLRIRFKSDKMGEKGKPFLRVKVIELRDRTKQYDLEMIEKLPVLDDLLVIHPYKKLKAIMLQIDKSESADDAEGDEDDEKSDKKATSSKKRDREKDDDDDDDEKDDDDDGDTEDKESSSDDDDDDEDDDEKDSDDDEDEKPAAKKSSKKKSDEDDSDADDEESKDDDDSSDDSDEDDSDDDDKKSDKDDDDDDAGDDDEDDDEDEEKPAKKSSKSAKSAKPAKKSSKAAKSDDDDDDDSAEDSEEDSSGDSDDDDDDDSDDDKGKNKWDDEDSDDDEEEKKPAKKSAKKK